MKRYKRLPMVYFFIGVILIVSNSYASPKTINLVKEKIVTLEKIDSEEGKIQKVSVIKKNDVLIISWKVLLRSKVVKGHVDIAIYSPENKLVKFFSTGAVIRKMSKGRGSIAEKTAHFKVTLSMNPKKGSVISVGFHKKKVVNSDSFQCGNNILIRD